MDVGVLSRQKYEDWRYGKVPYLEAVCTCNRIVHRDYSFSGSNLVNIYEDRMEFVSLGGIVSGLELKSIFLGVSQSRNPNLAAIFYRMRLIESYDTGIGEIERAYKNCASQPEFVTAKGVFRVTLPNRNEEQKQRSCLVQEQRRHFGCLKNFVRLTDLSKREAKN